MKRLFDLFFSCLGCIALFPLFVVVAIWIKLDSNGPIFYRQVRVGRHRKPFRIHKFRTMTEASDSMGRLTIGKDPRITRSGHFLRKMKIDELPQLIDVILGDMSLVGPRPEVQEFIDEYPSDIGDIVLSVRPGITDRASIEMVDENKLLADYEDPRQAYIDIILPLKQKYYVDYVNNQTLVDDLCIIKDTLVKIVTR
ncbi:sugar transferase [Vibrio mexicanus]|uniref:sugar transferase n=1 Tax=Vibrio mexicanus TaxID=1004326 RepID=UPI001EE356B1|nr:sugar transferase [Vibrio mexicanus]